MQKEEIKSTTEATTGLATELGKVMNSLTGIKDTFSKTLNTVSAFDTKLISSARNLGQSAAYAKNVENELGRAAVNGIKMGGSLDDVLTTFKEINASIGRTTYLSQQFYENVEAIEKYGVKGETINSFAKFFDKVGGGMDAATEKQIELVNTAKAYGLNVGTFLGSVAGKLDIVNKYGFPKGVNDLASMVAKSQLLGDSLSVAQGFADQIMDSPEKAYEYAAQLQTLGGSFSQLGDGAQLLYMAQNDLKGLNDQLINATRGIATFNKETGQFEISANERLRLKGLKNLGIEADKVEETALKLAKQEQIISQFKFKPQFEGLTEEQQQTLANYAQIQKGGVVTIEGQEIGGLSADKVKEVLSNLQGSGSELKNNTDANIDSIQRNLSATEAVTLANNQLSNAFAMATLKAGDFSKGLESYTGIVVKAQEEANKILTKVYTSGSDVLANVKSEFSTDTLIVALEKYTNAVSQQQFIEVKGNPTIDVKVTGIDVGLSDVIKKHIATEIANSIKTTTSSNGGYTVGAPTKTNG